MHRRDRVVVIGAGFGGLAVARGLRRAPVEVTLVDAHNFHTFQPLLYQVATAGLAADDIAYPVRGVTRRQRNVDLRMARVTAVDTASRTVRTSTGPALPYDVLVVAAGAVSHDFGIPGVGEHALPLKTLDDALALRDHVLHRFEQAAAGAPRAAPRPGELDVVICGGGPTGVELAGAFMELYHRVLARDFPRLDVRGARIVVVEMADRLLGAFGESSSAAARDALLERGVEVITGAAVAEVSPDGVVLVDGTVIPAGTVVWTAGVRANPLAAMLGVPLHRNGRIIVGPDLTVPGHPEIFAVGDIAVDPDAPLPQVALPAIQQGTHVAAQIRRRIAGLPTERFRYQDLGTMATIGRHDAVAELPNGLRLRGAVGWVAWLGLHLVRLMGFRNRAAVLVNWAWNYLTYDRASRLLSVPRSQGDEVSGGPRPPS